MSRTVELSDRIQQDRGRILTEQEIPCTKELRILGTLMRRRHATAASISVDLRDLIAADVKGIAQRLVERGLLIAEDGAHSDDPEVGKYYRIADQYRSWFGVKREKLLDAMREQYPDAFQIDQRIGTWLEPRSYW